MQRTSKTAHVGAAFFLCLSLAVVPVSLRVAGVQLTLSPRLAAAVEVWGQISEAFGGGYQMTTPSELAAVETPDDQPSNAAEVSSDRADFDCAGETGAAPLVSQPPKEVPCQVARIARRACPKTGERESIARSAVDTNTGELAVHAGAIAAAFSARANTLENLHSIKLDTAVQKEWLSALEKQFRVRRVESKRKIKDLNISEGLKVLIQMKSPVASNRAAECKVRAAMASVRRIELQRAGLVIDQSANPDNCEF